MDITETLLFHSYLVTPEWALLAIGIPLALALAAWSHSVSIEIKKIENTPVIM